MSLVIFDIDGTLFQTERVTVPAVQRVFARYELPIPARETVLGFFGKPVEAYEAWLADQCPPAMAEEIVAATNQLELTLIGEEGTLYPGAADVLEQLHDAGHALAICSNGPEPYVQTFLEVFGLRHFFSSVYARDTRYTSKEEMAGLILEEIRPDRFAVIGDRRDDIAAAHAWGGVGIAAAYGYGQLSEWTEADVVIHSISEAYSAVASCFLDK